MTSFTVTYSSVRVDGSVSRVRPSPSGCHSLFYWVLVKSLTFHCTFGTRPPTHRDSLTDPSPMSPGATSSLRKPLSSIVTRLWISSTPSSDPPLVPPFEDLPLRWTGFRDPVLTRTTRPPCHSFGYTDLLAILPLFPSSTHHHVPHSNPRTHSPFSNPTVPP